MQLHRGVRRRRPARQLLVAAVLLSACSHGEALRPVDDFSTENPHQPGLPTRLTYSTLEDQYPGWRSSGASFIYSFVNAQSAQNDRCLGEMPGTGGRITQTRCPANDNADDSTDVFLEPAPRADGTLAWLELHNLGGRVIWDYGQIVLGTMHHAQPGRVLVQLPYRASSGNMHMTAINLRWLTPTTLAYIGADALVRAPCIGCKRDTVIVPQEVMLLDTETGGAPAMVASSASTTSIWPDGAGGYYYTVAGSSVVYRRGVATDNTVIVHDFGVQGIARDISVANNTLSAVVGGKAYLYLDALLGTIQVDSGGTVMTVNLASSVAQTYPAIDSSYYRRPVLAPDGRSLVVEGVSFAETRPNLWLYQVP